MPPAPLGCYLITNCNPFQGNYFLRILMLLTWNVQCGLFTSWKVQYSVHKYKFHSRIIIANLSLSPNSTYLRANFCHFELGGKHRCQEIRKTSISPWGPDPDIAQGPRGGYTVHQYRDGILRERRKHARGRNLADCGKICRSPSESFGSIEKMWKKYSK